ncbi:MAG: ERCC4 domain-containing protein [Candidatus Ranarchaeia archaeon]
MKAQLDHREDQNFKKIVNKVFDEVEVSQLKIGDLIIHFDEYIVIIERKSVPDYIASIRDNRLWEQLLKMMQLNDINNKPVRRRILLVHGDFDKYIKRVSEFKEIDRLEFWNSINGANMEVLFVYDTPIVYVDSKEGLEAFLITLTKREMNGKNDKNPKSRWYRKRAKSKLPVKEIKKYTLSSLPLVGEKLAIELVDHFDKISNIANASVKDLMEVPGIGNKKAKRIFDVFH